MNYKIYELLKKLNKLALKNDDVPVSCIILFKNKIIAKAYNKRNLNKNPLDHAEIIAIQKASKKLNSYNLSECELYCSLRPCKMCESIIKESKIKKVYYILDNKKENNYKTEYICIEDQNNYFKTELQHFFKEKR